MKQESHATVNYPLLSVLIPTKNRQEYLLNVVEQVLGIKDPRLEVVVQDNGESDDLRQILAVRFQDSRLVYGYNKEVLSFVGNFSQGISLCTGKYITIIGDDDGLNPKIIDIAELALKNNIDAITPSLPIVYYWPNSGVPSVKEEGRLRISDFSNKAQFFNSKKEVKKLLKNGCQSYLSLKLAKVYHGMIKRSILTEIKKNTGSFVGGLSPDIYLSIAASVLIQEVLYIDYPLTISGICKKSGSSDSATGKHTGELKDAPHFKGHTNYKWSHKVPRFYSVETIWADSALAAISDLKKKELEKYFNLDFLSGYCRTLHPQFKDTIVDNLSKNLNIKKNSFATKLHLQKGLLNFQVRNFWIKVLAKTIQRTPQHVYEGVSNIQQAALFCQEIIGKNDKTLFENLEKSLSANRN